MVSAIHKHESATGIYVSSPSWTALPCPSSSHPSRLSQSTGFGFPASYSKFPPTVYWKCQLIQLLWNMCSYYLLIWNYKEFLFLGKVKLLSRVWLFATLWTVAHQAPLSMGFSRQEYWSGLPLPSPGDLPNPGIESRSPTLKADALTSEPPGKPIF